MERDVAEPQTQKLLEKIGLKKMDTLPLNDLDTKSEISSQLSEATVGKSHFLFKISSLDGNLPNISWIFVSRVKSTSKNKVLDTFLNI